MSVYFPETLNGSEWTTLHQAINRHWLDLTGYLGTHLRGQHIAPIIDAAFWGAYMSKHAARGEEHYQRQQGLLPEAWEASGRMWGKFGLWPVREDQFECDDATFYRFRRWVRRWQRSKILQQLEAGKKFGNKRQITAALGLLQLQRRGGPGAARSRVLGLGTFCPEDLSRRMLDLAIDHPCGYVADHLPKERTGPQPIE
jgi:hypothetical protein